MLRSMGLSHNVDSVDELMQDMAESHDDVRLIQTGLSASVGGGAEPDAADLEAELALLMADEDGDGGGGADGPAILSAANTMARTARPAGVAALTLDDSLTLVAPRPAARVAELAAE